MSKVGLYNSDEKIKIKTLSVLFYILLNALKIFHPVMPFVTEEIYQGLPNKDFESIMISSWPETNNKLIHDEIENKIEILKHLTTGIRNIRSLMNIKTNQMIKVILSTKEKGIQKLIKKTEKYIKFLANVEEVLIKEDTSDIKESAVNVVENIEIFVPLEGLVNIEQEKARLNKKIEEIKKELAGIEKKLKNRNFTKKAKKEAIEKVKEKAGQLKADLELLEKNISLL